MMMTDLKSIRRTFWVCSEPKPLAFRPMWPGSPRRTWRTKESTKSSIAITRVSKKPWRKNCNAKQTSEKRSDKGDGCFKLSFFVHTFQPCLLSLFPFQGSGTRRQSCQDGPGGRGLEQETCLASKVAGKGAGDAEKDLGRGTNASTVKLLCCFHFYFFSFEPSMVMTWTHVTLLTQTNTLKRPNRSERPRERPRRHNKLSRKKNMRNVRRKVRFKMRTNLPRPPVSHNTLRHRAKVKVFLFLTPKNQREALKLLCRLLFSALFRSMCQQEKSLNKGKEENKSFASICMYVQK